MPLCTPWRSVRTSTTTLVPPRSDVVSAGMSAVQLPASANTTTSARSASRNASRKPGRAGEPISSSPSTSTVTPTGSRPPEILPWARSAARCTATPALSSAVPRP